MVDQELNQNGAFKINDQYATGVRYEVTLDGDRFVGGIIKFMNGRKRVGSIQIKNREEALEILGERNVENIESAKGKEKNSAPGTAKGKLQFEYLAYKESYTPDKKPENTIEAGVDRQVSKLDTEVDAWMAKHREQIIRSRQQRLQNERIIESEELAARDIQSGIDTTTAKSRDDSRAVDRSKIIPAQIKERFIQADNKFYTPPY